MFLEEVRDRGYRFLRIVEERKRGFEVGCVVVECVVECVECVIEGVVVCVKVWDESVSEELEMVPHS